jgi:hypothetical protein
MLQELGEAVQDVGLAQAIQTGLARSQMSKPKFPDDETLQKKKLATSGLQKMQVYESALGKYLIQHFALQRGYNLGVSKTAQTLPSAALEDADREYTGGQPSEESLASHWDEFSASLHFEVYCKYSCLKEATASAPITPRLFQEARLLGRGAFGVVSLVFKRDTGMGMAVKKISKKIAKQNSVLDPCHAYRSLPAAHSPTPTPRTSLITAHSSSSLLTPHASIFTPHSSRLTPHASRLTPHASRLAPHASRLTPHTSLLITHDSILSTHYSLLVQRCSETC